MDVSLKEKIASGSCVLDDGTQRPSMNDVVWGLEFVLRCAWRKVKESVGNQIL